MEWIIEHKITSYEFKMNHCRPTTPLYYEIKKWFLVNRPNDFQKGLMLSSYSDEFLQQIIDGFFRSNPE